MIDRVLHAITWRLPSWLFYYYHVYLISTDRPKLFSRAHATFFRRLVTLRDLPLLEQFGISPKLVRERLAAGDRCVIMGHDSQIQSIIWGSSHRRYLYLTGAVLDPGETGVIIYAGYTSEEARFQGLFPSSFAELYRHYAAEGRERIYAAIHSTNTNSLKLHLRMNFQIVGETFYFRILGANVCFYKKWPHAAPLLHVFLRRPPGGLHWI